MRPAMSLARWLLAVWAETPARAASSPAGRAFRPPAPGTWRFAAHSLAPRAARMFHDTPNPNARQPQRMAKGKLESLHGTLFVWGHAEAEPLEDQSARHAADAGGIRRRDGARQREISVSEFFTKNRHLLGFDNPRKALLTCVKEAVDNALDACEEAGILPDVVVKVEAVVFGVLRRPPSQASRFRITVTDNGPGIIRQQIPPIFAKLLYGSKFHRLRMS